MVYDLVSGSGIDLLIQAYIASAVLSAFAFLYLGKKWSDRVPMRYVIMHVFIVTWSGLMYLNFLDGFETVISDYAWYMDWMISTPLIVAALGLTAYYTAESIDWSLIGALAGAQAMIPVAGLLAQSAETTAASMTFYAFGFALMLGVFYLIYVPVMNAARENSSLIYQKYKLQGLYIIVLWLSYPTVWLLGSPGPLGTLGAAETSALFVVLPFLCKQAFGFLDLYFINELGKELE